MLIGCSSDSSKQSNTTSHSLPASIVKPLLQVNMAGLSISRESYRKVTGILVGICKLLSYI